ncbi:MAG: HlyC/CorC family transporter [Chloroflexi bacterium]|nr:HlyC/CorC family transporter [Chloroflexota bacterium]
MDTGLRLLVVFVLVAVNGFFVAAEFALVTARKTRIEALAAEGNRAASAVRRALDEPGRFISASQLGITMAALALGWVGESSIAEAIEEPLQILAPAGFANIGSHAIAVPIAFILITFLDVTLGELVPKMAALQRAEPVAMFCIRPINILGTVFHPFISLLYSFSALVLRLIGMQWQAEHHQAYSVEDLKAIIRSTRGDIGSGDDPESIAERALDFSALLARHVMVPRTEMVAVTSGVSLGHLGELMRNHEHSRYPVFEGSPDNIIGVVSAKHLVAMLANPRSDEAVFDVRSYMTHPLFVPESMSAQRLLAELKLQRSHLAIVVDEYGATAGIVALRDLLDRIAGEVRDETEVAPPEVQWLPDGSAIVDGLALLSDVQDEFHIKLSDGDYDTLGGFVFGRLGRRPAVGDSVDVGSHRFTIEQVDGLRVARVRVKLSHDGSAPSG